MPAPRKPAGQQLGLVEHLASQAIRKPVNSALGIRNYYVSADLLLRQADSYKREANEEQQYVMLMRFASLLLETIPDHKDYIRNDPKYQRLKKLLVDTYFPQLETLKLSLKAKEIIEPTARSRNRPADAVMMATSNLPGINWGDGPTAAAATAARSSAVYDPASVRVDDLLDIIQNGPGPSARSAPFVPPPPSAPPGPALPDAPIYQPKYASSSNKHALFSAGPDSTGSHSFGRVLSGGHGSAAGGPPPLPGYPQSGSYRGSSEDGLRGQGSLPRYPELQAFQQLAIQQALPPTSGPALGPQEVGVITQSMNDPGIPDTCTHPHAPSAPPLPPPASTQPSAPPPPPAPARSDSGMREVVKRAAMRDVHVSVALMEEFLAYARSNTSRGIESCGILAGRLSANDSIFTITTLIIPKQQGTTDTVQALNEEEIFEVQFSQELYPLGWIHTHPTQTCFLSSIDVHTQCGYQTMLDEAVAIVMAPTDRSKKCGIFRLSTPGGLTLVQRCNLRGFHTHPATSTGQELYELCGHVYLNPRAKHSVIDLR